MTSRLLPFAICLGLVVGCSTKHNSVPDNSADDTETVSKQLEDDAPQVAPAGTAFTHKITALTEYYKAGPQQAQPPDGQFIAGTKVKLIEKAGSYSLVQSEDGIKGYVASDALAELEDGGS